jgi:ABC-2 type transport system ATP-binding protein
MTTLPLRGDHGAFAIETHGLTKRFGARAAVDSVDLRVPTGCAFGFLGPNGAGKTTLIRTVLGLTPASAGTVSILGLPQPDHRVAALAQVGAIIEEPRFHRHLTGRENLSVAAAVRGPEAEGRIEAVLERVGLSNRAAERVGAYSMGMRQRLGIARCLLSDPALLILDEPMNGVDPAGIHELRRMFRDLVDEGRTVFLSSHLLDEIEKTCDAVAIVDQGRLITQGLMSEVAGPVKNTVVIGCDDPERARILLGNHRAVRGVTTAAGRLHVQLVSGNDAAAAVNRTLVEAGLAVFHVEPERVSLEDRFLEITSRLGVAS